MLNRLWVGSLFAAVAMLSGCNDSSPPCEEGLTLCGTACVDLRTDRSHCGGCGMACGTDELCQGGTCVTSCSTGMV
ncbi:MAG TPA: hypothetical protein VIL20_30785, partial [Sandaracinaceae bacterium]